MNDDKIAQFPVNNLNYRRFKSTKKKTELASV